MLNKTLISRIENLYENQDKYKFGSNCLGTTFYAHNLNNKKNQPDYIPMNFLKYFKDESLFENIKKPGSIGFFETFNDDFHSILFLGDDKRKNFEQLGISGKFKFTDYYSNYDKGEDLNIKYYYPKFERRSEIKKLIRYSQLEKYNILPQTIDKINLIPIDDLFEKNKLILDESSFNYIYELTIPLIKEKVSKFEFKSMLVKSLESQHYGLTTSLGSKIFIEKSFNPKEYLENGIGVLNYEMIN